MAYWACRPWNFLSRTPRGGGVQPALFSTARVYYWSVDLSNKFSETAGRHPPSPSLYSAHTQWSLAMLYLLACSPHWLVGFEVRVGKLGISQSINKVPCAVALHIFGNCQWIAFVLYLFLFCNRWHSLLKLIILGCSYSRTPPILFLSEFVLYLWCILPLVLCPSACSKLCSCDPMLFFLPPFVICSILKAMPQWPGGGAVHDWFSKKKSYWLVFRKTGRDPLVRKIVGSLFRGLPGRLVRLQ